MIRTFDELTVVNIEVTSRCNLSCLYCARGRWGGVGQGRDMTPSEFKGIVRMFPRTTLIAAYLGGEPLLNPYLPGMIAAARQMGFENVRIHTNGTLIDGAAARVLAEMGLTSIVFSIDGADAGEYECIRGVPFPRVKRGLADTLDAAEGRMAVGVQCLVPAGRPLELNRDLADLAPRLSFTILDHPHSWTRAGAILESQEIPPSETPCFFLTRYMAVSADGEYLPCCCCLNHEGALGKVSEMSAREAWDGPMEEMRQAQERGEAVEPCSGCERFGLGAA